MLFTDLVSARAIALRKTSDPSNREAFLGEQFFINRRKMSIDVTWFKQHLDTGTALKPSALDAMATIRPRKGFEAVTEQMPLFRESMPIYEKNLSEIQRAQDRNDPYLDEVLLSIYNDTDELIEGARISVERMRMALLAPTDGNLEIKIGMADNTIYRYEYDKDGKWKNNHYMELTGSDTWDNPDTSTPLNDVQEAMDYLSGIGVIPTYAIMNSVTLNYLVRNEQIRSLQTSKQYGIDTGFMAPSAAKVLFNAATGLTILTYNKQYKDYDGTSKKYYPDNYVTIVGASALGSTWNGVTPEERTLIGDPKVDVSVLDDGTAIAIQTIYGPPVQYSTTASRIALPSFEGMDSVYVIKVK